MFGFRTALFRGNTAFYGKSLVDLVPKYSKSHIRAYRVSMSTEASPPTPPTKVKIALCQTLTGPDKKENVETATKAIKEAARNGAGLVVLPEMWNCPYGNESFPIFAEDIDGGASESAKALSEAAAASKVVLVGGSIPEKSGGKLYNTCLIFGRDGKLLGRHRKVHLFDIDIPGRITFRESDTLTPGGDITVVDADGYRLGVGICYDIRFPELAMLYAARGVQLLVYPGAFNMTTGPAHWELLQKARAVDNQLFVAACSPARNPDASYQAWGHSTIVGPFGEILGTTDEQPGIVYAELDLGEVDTRRQNMPLQSQKRWDLYTAVQSAQK
eukprot:jgi/Botrbrau1/498/Bobra.110_2s0128.1